jgi:predicted nucleic acid-binding protein
MANIGYSNQVPIAAILQRLEMAKSAGHHAFWPDDVSLTDATVFNHDELLGPKQITDRYLLALAVRNKGRFVTFDRAIRPSGVVGAAAKHLVQLTG